MDYDADGNIDIVTGSYTGQLYLFRGLAGGGWAQRETFKDETGLALLMPDYSVVPELVDMDADGDLDVVVGARSDPVRIIENIGTRHAPKWSTAFRELTTRTGIKIEGSNAHHADWDGDGLRDLVVGSEWGEVRWYRNRGKNDFPVYDPGLVLIARQPYGRSAEGSTPKNPGQRVKVHVTDWNGDGRVDLLVGDVTWQQTQGEPLSAEEQAEKAKLEAELALLTRKIGATEDAAAAKILAAKQTEIQQKIWSYDRTSLHTHGWVWLYLRAAAAAPGGR